MQFKNAGLKLHQDLGLVIQVILLLLNFSTVDTISSGYQGGKVPPRCHRVGKFLAKAVDQRLNTRFLIRK